MTVKCLFGPPDSEACVKIAEQVLGVAKKEFQAKWNLSILTSQDEEEEEAAAAAALPCSGSKSSSSSEARCWDWEEMAVLDECHHQSEKEQVTPRVPLLYVPNADNCEPGFVQRHGHLIVSMDADDQQVPDYSHDYDAATSAAAAAATAALLASLSPRRKGSSPRVTASLYSVHKSAFKYSKTAKNRLVSGFGDKDDKLASMKQRCITDYLKVKKVPGQMSAIKSMQ